MPRSKKSAPQTYTRPELRDKIKEKVMAGDKGGNKGQWSARKAQLVTQEYEKEGGGYKQPPNENQKHLKQWGDEHWQTSDKKKARRAGGTTRYLPEKAWKDLSPEEKASTNRKKRKGSQEGKQFVANTQAAATARKTASKKVAAKKKAAATKKPAVKKSTAKKSS